ncbi:class I SAM-dependent methyltransferase [uncultured Polaribacter sp.]|uniref:class I SAM-dependent methyltransferase n=1 Tax=uncultured Polaribacter sp. TaxID=174711 RepID=UPI0026220CA9|nr:class I SAM-dependent methyltransferase [uncultured Polaribacter sp.]
MEQVYDLSLWGGNEKEFYSGEGSHNPEMVTPYINAIQAFLSSFKNKLTVCDLGCGDFNIGNQLVNYAKTYIAIDIVASLIERNKSIFKHSNLTFKTLDITKAVLPTADCVIVRQVLQHLSNAEVQCIVKKLANYKYVLLTEHLPTGEFTPNKDIISGQGIRIKKQSGIHLLKPPFNFKPIYCKELVRISLPNNKGEIRTTQYTVF